MSGSQSAVLVIALALAAVVPATSARASTRRQATPADQQIHETVVREVNAYPRFSVFDDVSLTVDGGVVTLFGKVTMPFKRTDLARRASRVGGVKAVDNRLEVLPASPVDDALRLRIARAIYGNPAFWDYASMANPPIHIVVEHGRVTLTGVVGSEVDRMLARSLAGSSGALSVTNDLKTDTEMGAMRGR